MKDPKIEISTGCLAFFCAYGIFNPYNSFWPFLLSVALHEGGHLLALWFLKRRVTGIKGSLGGFVIQTPPLSYGQEMLTAASGPAVNFLLLMTMGRVYPVMALVNGILLCYNLLPFYPLDGGRILRCCLRLLLPLSLGEWVERMIGVGTYLLLFAGASYLTFELHSGLWPYLFCGFLFYRVGDTILPKRKTNPFHF